MDTKTSRAKEAISLPELEELGKAHLPPPRQHIFAHEDVNVVVQDHEAFFCAAAKKTRRLNPLSITAVARKLFGDSFSTQRESLLYGQSLSQAFMHCMKAGGKATTGEKLSASVWKVWKAAEDPASPIKAETPASSIKSDPALKSEPFLKTEKACLSPSKIMALYTGSAAVKDVFFINCNPRGHLV